MSFNHTFMVISTNFELEPLLASYLATYPDKSYSEYRVVYKVENERPDTPYSYIVVFTMGKFEGGLRVSFRDYLNSWCIVNRKKATAADIDTVLPELNPKGNPGYVIMGE